MLCIFERHQSGHTSVIVAGFVRADTTITKKRKDGQTYRMTHRPTRNRQTQQLSIIIQETQVLRDLLETVVEEALPELK